MISIEKVNEAADYLKMAAAILKPDQPYTTIEVLAAFSRGIETIDNPVLKPYSFTNPSPEDKVEF